MKIRQILETKRSWPFLTMSTQKSLNQLSAFLNLYQHAKYKVYSICSCLRESQFENPVTRLPTHIFDHAHPKNFLISYLHAKYQFIPSVHSSHSQFYSSVTRLATPIFDQAHPKICMKFVPAGKKSVS